MTVVSKRTFSKRIIDKDEFFDMPISSQSLYLHLMLREKEDGFVYNPAAIQRMIGASEDDLKLLVEKGLLFPFGSISAVIKHVTNLWANSNSDPSKCG